MVFNSSPFPWKRVLTVAFTTFMLLAIALLVVVFSPWQGAGRIDANADVTLPNYFMDGMVLQRDKPINIVGETSPGTRLTLSVGSPENLSETTTVADDDGVFHATLETPPSRLKPYQLTIASGDTELLSIDEVYIGDVFVAAGQSNMEANYYDYYRESDTSDFVKSNLPDTVSNRNIHFIVAEHDSSSTRSQSSDFPLRSYCAHHWLTATGSNSEYLGYLPQFFANRILSEHPNIPIGIIQTAWSGTDIAQHMAGGDIYNTHIAPLQDFHIAGILWYQGETDAIFNSTAYRYLYNFSTLISQYRQVFDDKRLPFLYVQLARYQDNRNTQIIRQAQLDTLSCAKHPETIGMTVSIDTDKGTEDSIHPLGKEIIAERMAMQWLAIYDNRTIPSGPIAQSAVRDGSSAAVVSFVEGTANGLQKLAPIRDKSASTNHIAKTTKAPITGFQVADTDGVFKDATAVINSDDTITVTSKNVQNIRQIRYLWDQDPDDEVLLYNSDTLPASPFVIEVG